MLIILNRQDPPAYMPDAEDNPEFKEKDLLFRETKKEKFFTLYKWEQKVGSFVSLVIYNWLTEDRTSGVRAKRRTRKEIKDHI